MAGDLQTGIDVMRMDAGLDTGPIAMREIVPIRPDDTAGNLASRLAAIAAKLSVRALRLMEAGLLEFHEQSTEGICYADKIKNTEADIDWAGSAETVRKQIHALSPVSYRRFLVMARRIRRRRFGIEGRLAMTSHPSVNFTPRMIFGNWLWPSRPVSARYRFLGADARARR